MNYIVNRDRTISKAVFACTNSGQLTGEEGLHWLSSDRLSAVGGEPLDRPVTCFNTNYGTVEELTERMKTMTPQGKRRVHLLALGDVGATVLLGLRLLGSDCIESIGICDINENVLKRYECEMNQMAWPMEYDAMPEVKIVSKEHLFDCDVFVFCASKSVPPVGTEGVDVRMVQLEGNRQIVGSFASQAAQAGYGGMFCVVSDPVDPLCRAAWLAGEGKLLPEQIQGFGLGVMNARAAYYAKKDERFTSFLTEGRAFGPHGADLVIANSIENYDEELSLELTKKTVEANLEVRGLGFKPYLAPAISSAAISLILMMRGEWHYSSNFLGGVWMGSRNRTTEAGLEIEQLPLPEPLYQRIKRAYENLKVIG
ncbi:MAG: lactate dehydrogenase [Firmicutes bacterium]|nr:lactate dehydrogenase [Bacillota bacterium]